MNELTKKESDVLKLLTTSKNPIKDTQQRLNISRNMVYKYINILKEKGVLRGGSYQGFTTTHPLTPPQEKKVYNKPILRLHGVQFNIRLFKETGYKRRIIKYRNHTIVFYKNSIQIYSKESFTGSTTKEITSMMFKYYDIFFIRLEDSFKIQFYKPNKSNISLVDGEIEEYDSETGKWLKKEKTKRLQVRGTNDGIVWLEYDKSFKGNNIETKHPKTFMNDAELIFDDVFNSYRDKTAFTPLQTTQMIGELVKDRLHHAENIKTHITAIQEMSSVLKEMKKELDKRKSLSKEWGW